MSIGEGVSVVRVETTEDLHATSEVLRSVFISEKNWANDEGNLVPDSDLGNDGLSWFIARLHGTPVGAVRVLYELPLDLYEEYDIKMLDPSLDVEAFIRNNRIAEVGRFAVKTDKRGQLTVAAALMRAVASEAISKRCTHFITDVFEGEPNSPYEFHTRVLGFKPVAYHDHGELKAEYRRITMLLDLRQAYERMKTKRSWLARHIFSAWSDELHEIAAGAAG